MRDSERRQALAAFIDEGERAQPPVFTGREKVIEDIAGAAELVYRKWLSGSVDAMDPGLTRLVQGAPGAGKTALLRRLQERWRGGPAPGCPIAVRVSASALASPEGMRAQLLEQVPKTIMDKWGPVVMGGLARLIPGGEAVGPAAEAATEEALRERREKRLPAAIVVMVDETTRVEPHSAAATTLQNLHDGSFGVVPVLPVFAGLGYLHSHLQQKDRKSDV